MSTDDLRGRFARIQGLAMTADRLYVLDAGLGHVQVLDLGGTPLGFIGRRGRCPRCVALPLGIALSGDRRLVLADPERRRWITLSLQLRSQP